jgi:hypothetical protein
MYCIFQAVAKAKIIKNKNPHNLSSCALVPSIPSSGESKNNKK